MKHIANIITGSRIVFSIALLFFPPLSSAFYVLYAAAGLTDMIDGTVARKTNTVTEDELKKQGVIHTGFGEDLSWEYLCYVRSHPIKWNCPTAVLYGSCDDLTSYDTIKAFAEKHNAALTVMENGEHWFHTKEQMKFLDDWIKR